MSKKYVRYYLVVKEKSTDYRKIESDLPFSEEEGMEAIKENNPDARDVNHIAKSKAEMFLGLK